MLKELEHLSQKINRFIVLHEEGTVQQHDLQQRYSLLEQELEQTKRAFSELQTQYQALQTERNTLTQKITHAQLKLNAIIDQLPRPETEETTL